MSITVKDVADMVERVDEKLSPLTRYDGFQPYEGIYRLGDWGYVTEPVPVPEDESKWAGEDEFLDDEPAPITQEIAEVPPKVNTFAVSYATLPDLMMAKECPELQGLGHIKAFRTSKGKKVAYIASANGKCVVAYRARYERGSDKQLEQAVADYVAVARDLWAKAA